MATENAILTALPNGRQRDGRLRLTMFVSPRLSTDGPDRLPLRGSFPAFEDWPAALAQLELFVELDGGTVATTADHRLGSPDSATWRLLFDADADLVGTGELRDLSDRTVRSFPAAEIARQITTLYQGLATSSATDFPAVTTGPLADFADLVDLGRGKGEHYARLDGLIAQEVGPGGKSGRFLDRRSLSSAERRRLAWVEATRFYDRPGSQDPNGIHHPGPAPKAPEIDFHGYVASLGDYPLLLRRLGLAVDLLFEPPAGLPAQGRVRMRVAPRDPVVTFCEAEAARPWTSYEIRDRRFLARNRDRADPPYADGSLRLDDEKLFTIHQIDVDGSALKAVGFAASATRVADHLAGQDRSMTADESSVPALRTGGFVVAHGDRDRSVVDQLDAAADHEGDHAQGQATELYAEDVIRGYRPDVLTGGRWLSLSMRDGTYVVTRGGVETPIAIDPDEGFVKGSSTTSVPGHDDELYLHEAVFGWDGWSLVAKRPGQAILDTTGNSVGTVAPKPPADFPFVTSFTPQRGSLPRLRFGEPYRIRARLVDLAGNSVEERALAHHESREHVFRRFDPVPSPAVIPLRRFTEGESLLRMVIRSTLGDVPPAYVALPRIVGLAGHTDPDTRYLEANERHLAPPKTSVQLAEWHRMFDAATRQSATQGQLDQQFATAARESGSYIETGPGVEVVNPDPGATPTALTGGTWHKGLPLQPGEYLIHDVPQLGLPYLPDVMSAGASLQHLPGDTTSGVYRWRGGPWPELDPMRIRIEHGGLTTDPQRDAEWDAGTGVLTVYLRQADMFTVRLSSAPDPARLEEMGVWTLVPGPSRSALEGDALRGRHWMLTPYQEITLVHAVEQPLTPPEVKVTDAGVQRRQGETFAVLSGTIGNHAKSTGRLDIDAEWSEPIDDIGQPGPTILAGHAHVGDFTLEADEDACRVGRDDVAPTATTAAVHRVRHELHDTKHRTVGYHATATTRFREYFPPEITDDPERITHVGPVHELDVPSSRRPDPPSVLYVVPTFSWHEEGFRGLLADLEPHELPPAVARAVRELPGGMRRAATRLPHLAAELPKGIRLPSVLRRTRRAGLRVYLDRPWYSSGAGELLGVVVPDQPWLPWMHDIERGMVASPFERARADELAERIFAEGLMAGHGSERLSPSERLMRGLARRRPGSAVVAEALARAGSESSPLTTFQSSLLTGVLSEISLLLASGDPDDYVTRWAKDPIWGSDTPASGPWIHQLPLRSAVGTGLSLAEAPGHTVAVVGHTPQYDPDRRLWYCDVDIDAGTSYFPFVRLGLARYQPSSIPGEHLSRVVTPEWMQLVADRTATMTTVAGGSVRVTVRGPGGFTDLAEDLLGLAAAGPQGMAMSRVCLAQVERLPAGASTDLAWEAVGREVELTVSIEQAYRDIKFTGRVPVPRRARGEQLRLSVREYEILETDTSQTDRIAAHQLIDEVDVSPGGIEVHGYDDSRGLRYRMVYADHLPL